MIKIEVEEKEAFVSVEGYLLTLMSELTLGTARALYEVLKNCPVPKLKETLIKMYFETTLMALDRMEGEEE